jgi:dephospho-CoA kinase
MLNVALTGNIAAGKSRVAALFRRWGTTVIDADALVREVQEPGTPVFHAIVARFGATVLGPDGRLNRPALRQIVFQDPVARASLESLVHPAVQGRRREQVEEARRRREPLVISDIPLLFESMDPDEFDAVVLVDAPEAERLARLMRDRHLPQDEAEAMIRAQLPTGEKRRWRSSAPGHRRPYVIDNDTDLETLEGRARAVYDALLARAAPTGPG